MTNKLIIKREYYPEATNIPHFVVKLRYETCEIEHDDIYFDKIDDLAIEFELLERNRKGKVSLDGGNRFRIIIEMSATGNVNLKFKTQAGPSFPGTLSLEGFFHISGEYASSTLKSFIKLIVDGDEFVI